MTGPQKQNEAGGSSRTTAGTQRQTVSQALFAPAAAGALIPYGQFRIKVLTTFLDRTPFSLRASRLCRRSASLTFLAIGSFANALT